MVLALETDRAKGIRTVIEEKLTEQIIGAAIEVPRYWDRGRYRTHVPLLQRSPVFSAPCLRVSVVEEFSPSVLTAPAAPPSLVVCSGNDEELYLKDQEYHAGSPFPRFRRGSRA